MRLKLITTFILLGFAVIIIPATASANLVLNGDFENGLNNWTTVGEVNAVTATGEGFTSPSGDNSLYALLVSRYETPNSTLQQIVDMDQGMYRLSLDFTLATYEPSWSDDMRAQLSINYPGGGPYTPIFSYGTGDGVFQNWTTPGVRYYSVQGFTYDFYWGSASDNLVLDFHVLGYTPDQYASALMVDNVDVSAIPEPGTLSLLFLGFGFVATRFRRKK